jgi:hypothetical protein
MRGRTQRSRHACVPPAARARVAGGAPHRLPSRSAAVHWRASGDMSMSSSMLMSDSVGPGEEEASLTATAAEAPALGSAGAASGGGATLSRTSTAACEACEAQRGRPAVGVRRRAACGASRTGHTSVPGTLAQGAAVGGGETAALRTRCPGFGRARPLAVLACADLGVTEWLVTGCACMLRLHTPTYEAAPSAGKPRQDSGAAAPATRRTAPTRARRRPPTAAAACAQAAAAAHS